MDKRMELVKEWLYKASHDLEMAQLAMEYKPELRDSICFHCQQAGSPHEPAKSRWA